MSDPYLTPIKKNKHLLPPMAPRKQRDPISTIVAFASLPDPDQSFGTASNGSKLVDSHSSTDQHTIFVFSNFPQYLHHCQANLPKLCELLQQCTTSYIDWKYHVIIPREKLKEIAELVQSLHFSSVKPVTLVF